MSNFAATLIFKKKPFDDFVDFVIAGQLMSECWGDLDISENLFALNCGAFFSRAAAESSLLIGELKAAIKLRPQLGLHVDLFGEGPVLRNSQGPLNFVVKSRGRNFFIVARE